MCFYSGFCSSLPPAKSKLQSSGSVPSLSHFGSKTLDSDSARILANKLSVSSAVSLPDRRYQESKPVNQTDSAKDKPDSELKPVIQKSECKLKKELVLQEDVNPHQSKTCLKPKETDNKKADKNSNEPKSPNDSLPGPAKDSEIVEDHITLQQTFRGRKRKAAASSARGKKRKSLMCKSAKSQSAKSVSNIAESVKLKRRRGNAINDSEAEDDAEDTGLVKLPGGMQKKKVRQKGKTPTKFGKSANKMLLLQRKKETKGHWRKKSNIKNDKVVDVVKASAVRTADESAEGTAECANRNTVQHDDQERTIIAKINLLRRDPAAAIQREIDQMNEQLEQIRMRRRSSYQSANTEANSQNASELSSSTPLVYMDVCGGATWQPPTEPSTATQDAMSYSWDSESAQGTWPVISNVMSVDSQLIRATQEDLGSNLQCCPDYPAVYIKQEPVDFGYYPENCAVAVSDGSAQPALSVSLDGSSAVSCSRSSLMDAVTSGSSAVNDYTNHTSLADTTYKPYDINITPLFSKQPVLAIRKLQPEHVAELIDGDSHKKSNAKTLQSESALLSENMPSDLATSDAASAFSENCSRQLEGDVKTDAEDTVLDHKPIDAGCDAEKTDSLPADDNTSETGPEGSTSASGSVASSCDMKPPLLNHANQAHGMPPPSSPDLPPAHSPSLTTGAAFGRLPSLSCSYQPGKFMDSVSAHLARFLQGCMAQASTEAEVQQLAQVVKATHAVLSGVPAKKSVVNLPVKTEQTSQTLFAEAPVFNKHHQSSQACPLMVDNAQSTDLELNSTPSIAPVQVTRPRTVRCREQFTQMEPPDTTGPLSFVRCCTYCKTCKIQVSREVQTSVQIMKEVGHQTVLELACLRCAAEPKTHTKTVQTSSSYLRSHKTKREHRYHKERSRYKKKEEDSESLDKDNTSGMTGLLASHLYSSAHLFSTEENQKHPTAKRSCKQTPDEEFAVPMVKKKHKSSHHCGSSTSPAEVYSIDQRLHNSVNKVSSTIQTEKNKSSHEMEIPSPKFHPLHLSKCSSKDYGFTIPNYKPGLLLSASRSVQSPSDHECDGEAKGHKPVKIPLDNTAAKPGDPRLRHISGDGNTPTYGSASAHSTPVEEFSPRLDSTGSNLSSRSSTTPSSEDNTGLGFGSTSALKSAGNISPGVYTQQALSCSSKLSHGLSTDSHHAASSIDESIPASKKHNASSKSSNKQGKGEKKTQQTRRESALQDHASEPKKDLQLPNSKSNSLHDGIEKEDGKALESAASAAVNARQENNRVLTMKEIRRQRAKTLVKALCNKSGFEYSSGKAFKDDGAFAQKTSLGTGSGGDASNHSQNDGSTDVNPKVMKTQLLTCLDKLEQALKASKAESSANGRVDSSDGVDPSVDIGIKTEAKSDENKPALLYSPGYSPITENASVETKFSHTSAFLRMTPPATKPCSKVSSEIVATPFGEIGTRGSFVDHVPCAKNKVPHLQAHRLDVKKGVVLKQNWNSPLHRSCEFQDGGVASPDIIKNNSSAFSSPLLPTPGQHVVNRESEFSSVSSPVISTSSASRVGTPSTPVMEYINHDVISENSPLLSNPPVTGYADSMTVGNRKSNVDMYGRPPLLSSPTCQFQDSEEQNDESTTFRNPSPPVGEKTAPSPVFSQSSSAPLISESPPPPPLPPLPSDGPNSPPPPPLEPGNQHLRRRPLLPPPASSESRQPLLSTPQVSQQQQVISHRWNSISEGAVTERGSQYCESYQAADDHYSTKSETYGACYEDYEEDELEPGEYVEDDVNVNEDEYYPDANNYAESNLHGVAQNEHESHAYSSQGYRTEHQPTFINQFQESISQNHPPAFCGSSSLVWSSQSQQWPT